MSIAIAIVFAMRLVDKEVGLASHSNESVSTA